MTIRKWLNIPKHFINLYPSMQLHYLVFCKIACAKLCSRLKKESKIYRNKMKQNVIGWDKYMHLVYYRMHKQSWLTQCMPRDNATALALILEANISGRSRAGTGPAPKAKDSTYLHKTVLELCQTFKFINLIESAKEQTRWSINLQNSANNSKSTRIRCQSFPGEGQC